MRDDEPTLARRPKRKTSTALIVALVVGAGVLLTGLAFGGLVALAFLNRNHAADKSSGPTAAQAPAGDGNGRAVAGAEPPTPIQTDPLLTDPALSFGSQSLEGYKDNRVAADARYKGKKVRIEERVEVIDVKDGKPCLTFFRIGGRVSGNTLGGSMRIGSESEPQVVCVMADPNDPELLTLRPGRKVKVEGVLTGRVDDRVFRNIPGYEFHVLIERCQIVTEPTPKR